MIECGIIDLAKKRKDGKDATIFKETSTRIQKYQPHEVAIEAPSLKKIFRSMLKLDARRE